MEARTCSSLVVEEQQKGVAVPPELVPHGGRGGHERRAASDSMRQRSAWCATHDAWSSASAWTSARWSSSAVVKSSCWCVRVRVEPPLLESPDPVALLESESRRRHGTSTPGTWSECLTTTATAGGGDWKK